MTIGVIPIGRYDINKIMGNMKHFISLLVAILCLTSCMNTGGRNSQQQNTPQSKTVFSYDGGTIVLYDNKSASVNGVGGLWSYSDDTDILPSLNNITPYYYVNYGNNNIAVISVKIGMIYFGPEREASDNRYRASMWHEYRKHRE